jgi:hypothetical protein
MHLQAASQEQGLVWRSNIVHVLEKVLVAELSSDYKWYCFSCSAR